MAIFDEIGKKITNAGQNVVKGTKDFAEVTRLNAQIAEEQKQITALYTQLGSSFFDKYGGDEGAPFRDVCGDIAAALERIAGCQAEIQQIKGIKVCPQCAEELALSAAFCSACGTPVEKPLETVEPVEAKRFCTGCGTELGDGAAFCTSCGQKAE